MGPQPVSKPTASLTRHRPHIIANIRQFMSPLIMATNTAPIPQNQTFITCIFHRDAITLWLLFDRLVWNGLRRVSLRGKTFL